MNSLDAFRMWVSVRLHFTKKNWDVRAKGFNIKCSYEHLMQRDDFKSFEKIPTQFTQREFFKYLVANSVYGFDGMIYDTVKGKHNVNVWDGNKQQLSNVLEKDIETINLFRVANNPQKIISLMVRQKITIESVIIINSIVKLTDMIRKIGQNSIIENLLLRIDKAAIFFDVSEEQKNKIKNNICCQPELS